MTIPNELWPPEAAIDAACQAFNHPRRVINSQREHLSVTILATLPHLGLAELLLEAAAATEALDDAISDEHGGMLEYDELCDRLRETADRLEGKTR